MVKDAKIILEKGLEEVIEEDIKQEMTSKGRCKHVWFHVPNEDNSRNKQRRGMRQRNMEKFAGVADYIFIGNNYNLSLEIKDGKKPLSLMQEQFKLWCNNCHAPFETAHSFEEAVEVLNKYSIS